MRPYTSSDHPADTTNMRRTAPVGAEPPTLAPVGVGSPGYEFPARHMRELPEGLTARDAAAKAQARRDSIAAL